jgi:hypothetical protein
MGQQEKKEEKEKFLGWVFSRWRVPLNGRHLAETPATLATLTNVYKRTNWRVHNEFWCPENSLGRQFFSFSLLLLWPSKYKRAVIWAISKR